MSDPSPDALRYAAKALTYRRQRAMTALLTGDARENVASMVLSYVGEDVEDVPTADDVAGTILRYVATLIEPLMTEEAPAVSVSDAEEDR